MRPVSRLRRRLETPSKRRAAALAALSLVLVTVALVGFVSANESTVTIDERTPERNTLVGLQGYHDEGRALELAPDGTVVWEYTAVENVFDVESLGPDRVQIAGADAIPDEQCPARYRDDGTRGCVHNTVRIVNQETNETQWQYGWYDVERHEHELHDVDRYTAGGEARWVFADMGNDRVFAIDRDGTIQWQWNANATYDPPADVGPEDDWTHLNDVDKVGEGRFQVSLRNFDTVVELRVASDGTVAVEPLVGPNRFTPNGSAGPLYAQHNPDRLADGHLLVADSENDRIVEFENGTPVWTAGGSARLDWPRDADRLASGNTLVVDSYNDRIVELDGSGEAVWAVETGRLPYDADRIPRNGSGEGSRSEPTADASGFDPGTNETSSLRDTVAYGLTLLRYSVPNWVDTWGLLVGGLLCGVAAVVEGRRLGR
ncbi:hypothetical protein C448_01824 [Halococcus morrhuae DSM 1307]|uniref:Uncharacterized protein n=1 Tax=Halococcus morrhuae DSM 1307 TaxID=931277 RepID=M0MUS5_HALMO|nr:hypothetical protein C448_01824 [Halococcus morrhuae DSM 1307]